MRQISKRAFSFLGICFLIGNLAVAQRTLPAGIWQRDVGLLGYVQVRDELKLTADQMENINALGDELIKEGPAPQRQAGITKEERQKKIAAFQSRREEMIQKAKALLTADQANRMRQIELWCKGPTAFVEADVARELDLTGEQKGALKTFADEYSNKVTESRQSFVQLLQKLPTKAELDQYYSDEEVAQRKAQYNALRETNETKCLTVLTDEQKARFVKMRGPRFELDEVVPSRN